MQGFWERADRVSIIGGLAGIIVIIAGLVYYFVKIEYRIDALESQIKTLSSAASTAPLDPMVGLCIEFAHRRSKDDSDAINADDAFKINGCKEILAGATKK